MLETRECGSIGVHLQAPVVLYVQDVHWSAGLFGYFPTYSLGAMYAAQIYKVSFRNLSGQGILSDVEDRISCQVGDCLR